MSLPQELGTLLTHSMSPARSLLSALSPKHQAGRPLGCACCAVGMPLPVLISTLLVVIIDHILHTLGIHSSNLEASLAYLGWGMRLL